MAAKMGEAEKTGVEVEQGGQLWFEDPESGASMAVMVDEDTIWMTQRQLSKVFEVGDSTVSQHLTNAYAAEEIDPDETIRTVRVTREEGGRQVARSIKHYNLDAVLAVGYRVSSRRGTRFRKWATRALREKMMQELDQRRRSQDKGLEELAGAFRLLQQTIEANAASAETRAILATVDRYARAFTLLLQYDEDRLPDVAGTDGEAPIAALTAEEARDAVWRLKSRLAERGEDTDLFGQERGEGLDAVLGAIEQTFGGTPLYPTWRSRAAHLLYFIIKNHPFSDGNKRIGSFLFLRYLDKQRRLFRADGRPLVEDNALVAIALLIAESKPAQRDLVLRLVLGLISEEEAAGDAR